MFLDNTFDVNEYDEENNLISTQFSVQNYNFARDLGFTNFTNIILNPTIDIPPKFEVDVKNFGSDSSEAFTFPSYYGVTPRTIPSLSPGETHKVAVEMGVAHITANGKEYSMSLNLTQDGDQF